MTVGQIIAKALGKAGFTKDAQGFVSVSDNLVRVVVSDNKYMVYSREYKNVYSVINKGIKNEEVVELLENFRKVSSILDEVKVICESEGVVMVGKCYIRNNGVSVVVQNPTTKELYNLKTEDGVPHILAKLVKGAKYPKGAPKKIRNK